MRASLVSNQLYLALDSYDNLSLLLLVLRIKLQYQDRIHLRLPQIALQNSRTHENCVYPARSVCFSTICQLLLLILFKFANSLDPDRVRRNVDLDSNYLKL